MDRHELAWAAGFFDGEGWAGKSKRGVQSRVNQAGPDGMPAVLVNFQRIVGVGRLKGPQVTDGKQDLFWWEATSRPDVGRVADLLGPWLCPVKRAAFERTLGRSLAPRIWPGSASEERAWAGGFFDGEGSTYLEKHRTHASYFVPRLYVPQSSELSVAVELIRLKSALADLGKISGVRRPGGKRRPYRRWRVFTPAAVQLGLHLLWPFIGDVKRSQAQRVMNVIHSLSPTSHVGIQPSASLAHATAYAGTTSGTRESAPSRVAEGIKTIRTTICGSAWSVYGSMRVRGQSRDQREIGSVSAADPVSPSKLLLVEVVLVDLGVVLPLVRYRILGEDRAHRTHGLTRAAVDAFIGMDEVHVVRVGRINAVHRTDIEAACILHIDAWFRDHIRHFESVPPQQRSCRRLEMYHRERL